MNIDNIKSVIKNLGYDCETKSSKRIILKTDKNRVDVLKEVVNYFNKQCKAVYDPNQKGSTTGGAIIENIVVLAKPKTKKNTVHYEITEINSINQQFERIKEAEGWDYIPIEVKGAVYKCNACCKTLGTPKSDFHLIGIDGNPNVWISHKAGRTAKDFQQWGGCSQREEPNIFNTTEVQKFIKDVQKKYPDGNFPKSTTIARKISSSKLKGMAVYGNEYLGKLGPQNVTFVCQGPINVVKLPNGNYTLKALKTHINGDKIEGDYTPALMIYSRSDRTSFGLKCARASIYPIGGRKITEEI